MIGLTEARPRALDRGHLVIAGYSLAAGWFQPLTLPAAAAVLLAGVPLLLVRVRRPVRPLPAGARPGPAAALWLGLLAAFGVWELAAGLWGNDAEHPTLSLLCDPALEHYPVRVLGYVLWLLAGRWLVTR